MPFDLSFKFFQINEVCVRALRALNITRYTPSSRPRFELLPRARQYIACSAILLFDNYIENGK